LDKQLEESEERIQKKLKPFQREKELLERIPGLKEMTAAGILAKVGPAWSHSNRERTWQVGPESALATT
jgi:transposase